MIAEIHGKVSSSGSNLHDRLEDQLTGDVFGSLKYVTYKNGLYPLLTEADFHSVQHRRIFENKIASIQEPYVAHHLKFWEKKRYSEIDVRLDFSDVLIGVEVKYQSGLSSDDQLEREAKDLIALSNGRPVFLLLLAPEPDVNMIVQQTLQEENFPESVMFGYLSWQAVLKSFLKVVKCHDLELHESLIYKDLIELLKKRKGFTRFEDFHSLHIPPIQLGSFFQLMTGTFEFGDIKHKIQKGLYYEFK